MLMTVLIVLLILALVGALPVFGYNANWGPAPAGGLGIVVIIIIVLLLVGRI